LAGHWAHWAEALTIDIGAAVALIKYVCIYTLDGQAETLTTN